MFDPTKPTEEEQQLIAGFHSKRALFDHYIKEKKLPLCTCAGCGYPTLRERGGFEICVVCNWEDDGQDDKDADKIMGGPNGWLSLTENRVKIGKLLSKYADSQQSAINLDPSFVLNALEIYARKREAIEQQMTGDELREHPLWIQWQLARTDLQRTLSKGNDHS